MFEYFMPLLIMKNYEGTLLDQTYKSVIKGQQLYAKDKRYLGEYQNLHFIILMEIKTINIWLSEYPV
ncbi:hypothetical protein JTT01_05145 [Clostridium botulinum]|nr:hypothetical protein [Clostridium botulinum]